MEKKQVKTMPFPPVLKLLFRGYLIMVFILAMEWLGIISDIGLIIFLVTVVSISMVFGVGYLLVMKSRPVRSGGFDIPNTVLFFVKGILVLFFVTMLAQFGILPDRITSILMLIIAGILVLAGVLSYLYEVMERSRPLPKRRIVYYKNAKNAQSFRAGSKNEGIRHAPYRYMHMKSKPAGFDKLGA